MIVQHWSALLCLVSLAALMGGEYKQNIKVIAGAKTIASTAFIITAYRNGAFENLYGQLVFAALVLSWWGDVFLIPPSERIFKLGIFAFLLGHFGFAGAFISLGFDFGGAIFGLCAVLLIGSLVIRWLYPKLETGMRLPVIAYVFVISSMVVDAAALNESPVSLNEPIYSSVPPCFSCLTSPWPAIASSQKGFQTRYGDYHFITARNLSWPTASRRAAASRLTSNSNVGLSLRN